MRDELPGLLAEIADITDVGTALAVAQAAGGTTTTIAAQLREDNWLVKAVGMEKAKVISDYFTAGGRLKVFVPFGPAGSYNAERRRRAEALAKALGECNSVVGVARRVGITDRSVWRAKAKLKNRKASDQGDLF